MQRGIVFDGDDTAVAGMASLKDIALAVECVRVITFPTPHDGPASVDATIAQ